MRRALALARRGGRRVRPNPMVGAVVTAAGRLVGEGYHRVFGGQHAEVVALERAGVEARGGTLYVNLEPCAHHGKTPPCVDAIIAAGIARVVAATRDPNPLVSGRGITMLRAAGIEVAVGEGREAAEFLNAGHFNAFRLGRPLVTLKIAATLDGRIAAAGGESKWITSEASRREVHRLRADADAVVVGRGTVERDDPSLTVRHVRGRNPVRVVLDSSARAPRDRRVFTDGTAPTIQVTLPGAPETSTVQWELKAGPDRHPDLALFAERAVAEGWRHVLVEGGARVAAAFLRAGLVDRIFLFTAPKVLGGGGSLSWAGGLGPAGLPEALAFRFHAIRRLGPDVLAVLVAERAEGA